MEINCCSIALAAIVVNLISLIIFFNYTLKISGKDRAISITANKEVLPVNWKGEMHTNYNPSKKEKLILQLQDQIDSLKKQLEELKQDKINNNNNK